MEHTHLRLEHIKEFYINDLNDGHVTQFRAPNIHYMHAPLYYTLLLPLHSLFLCLIPHFCVAQTHSAENAYTDTHSPNQSHFCTFIPSITAIVSSYY